MSTVGTSNGNDSDLVDFVDPKLMTKIRVHCAGRFPYSREYDYSVNVFDTSMGRLTIGQWLGGENKVEQQDAVFAAEDANQNLWIAVIDGLGGHPGGAEASQICCDVLKEEVEAGIIHVDYILRNKIRMRMARDRIIMQNPKRPGGACIAIVCINSASQKLESYSMGDCEVCVQRDGKDVILANELDTGDRMSQVSKVISPRVKEEFTYAESRLLKGDRLLVHSDGLTNKAFKAFGDRYGDIRKQIRNAILISQRENGVNADNLTVACLQRFDPSQTRQGIYTVQLGADPEV